MCLEGGREGGGQRVVGGGWYIFQSNLILSIILYSNIKFILGIAYFQIKIIIIKNENPFFFNANIHLSLAPFLPCPQLSYHLLLDRYRELVTARLNIKWSSRISYHQPNKFQLKCHKNDTERFLVVETHSEVLLHQSLRPLFIFSTSDIP